MINPGEKITPLNQLLACLIATNKNSEVEDLVKRHINGSNEHDLRYYLGLSYASQGKITEALNELRQSVGQTPGDSPLRKLAFKLYMNQAKVKARDNDFEGLSSMLTDAVGLGLDDPEREKEFNAFRNILPLSYLSAGERAEAARIWEEELRKNPASHHAVHNLALLYYWWALDVEEGLNNNQHGGIGGDNKDEALNKGGGPGEDALRNIDILWEKSIAYWVMLLNTDSFWKEWKNEREKQCSLTIDEKDIRENVNKLIDERFNKLFNNYIDKYKKKGRDEDTLRHEGYVSKLILEKRTSSCYRDMIKYLSELGLKFDGTLKRWELIRLIQEEEGNTPCFGTVKGACKTSDDCYWIDSCVKNIAKNNDNVLLSHPCGPLMIKEMAVSWELIKLAELCSKSIDNNNKLLKLLVYLSPMGEYFVLIDDQHKPQKAIAGMEGLPEKIRDSVEYKFLYALALSQKSIDMLQGGSVSDSLRELAMAMKAVDDALKLHNNKLKPLLEPIRAKVEKEVVSSCKKEARKLKDDDRFDDAVNILKKGLEIVDSKSLKQHIAVVYCDRGSQKLNKKQFSSARKDFKTALSYDSENKRANQSIGTTYNNEGVATSSSDKSIPLFEKALKYDPDSDVIKNNLAGAYNGKAVAILNSLSQYSSSSTCDSAINLLKKGLELVNPKLKVANLENLAYTEEWNFNNMIKDWPDDMYKTMMRNIWVGYRSRRNLRGY